MKKGKIVGKIISRFLLLILIFLLLLLIKSADWFLDNFGEVAFSTVVYQLSSPMKGTASDLLNSYCSACFYPSVFLSLLFMAFYSAYDILLRKICIKSGNRFRLISKCLVLGLGCFILCILVWNRAVLIGIPEYIQSITNSSLLYQEEYINPNDVSIEFPEQKRNLLLIYLEGMETTYASVDAGGGKPVNYIPGLTALANKNIYFSNDDDLGGAGRCPGTGWTMGGILASSTGVNYKLPIEGNSAGEYKYFLPGLTTVGDILEDAGYQNYFMCGSDAVFGGRLDFFSQHGHYNVLDYYSAIEDGIIPKDYYEFWGMEDEYLYEYAKQELTKIASKKEPFNFTMLTVDTHHPDGYICELCDDEYSEQFANVIACADKQVCQFVDWVKEQDWYEDTTIIITGDHTNMKADFWEDIGDYERKIYNCFIHLPEGLSPNRTTNRVFSTMDMFPTILAAMGVSIEGERLGLGTNLFSAEKTLPEKMGFETFNEELELYSGYYYTHFIVAGDK